MTGEVPAVAEICRLSCAPHKLLCIGPDGITPERVAQVAAAMPEGTVARRSHSAYLEVTLAAADKPVGVEILAPRLGFCAEQVVALGDGDTDLGMFAYAGTAVAMGNATPAIARAATMTTATHDQDGIARCLRSLIDEGSMRPVGAENHPTATCEEFGIHAMLDRCI